MNVRHTVFQRTSSTLPLQTIMWELASKFDFLLPTFKEVLCVSLAYTKGVALYCQAMRVVSFFSGFKLLDGLQFVFIAFDGTLNINEVIAANQVGQRHG